MPCTEKTMSSFSKKIVPYNQTLDYFVEKMKKYERKYNIQLVHLGYMPTMSERIYNYLLHFFSKKIKKKFPVVKISDLDHVWRLTIAIKKIDSTNVHIYTFWLLLQVFILQNDKADGPRHYFYKDKDDKDKDDKDDDKDDGDGDDGDDDGGDDNDYYGVSTSTKVSHILYDDIINYIYNHEDVNDIREKIELANHSIKFFGGRCSRRRKRVHGHKKRDYTRRQKK